MIQTKYFSLAQRRYFFCIAILYIFRLLIYISIWRKEQSLKLYFIYFDHLNFSTIFCLFFFWFMQSNILCCVYQLISWTLLVYVKTYSGMSWNVLEISFILLFFLECPSIILLPSLGKRGEISCKILESPKILRKICMVTMSDLYHVFHCNDKVIQCRY